MPAVLVCLVLFYIARFVVADELIYANYRITALQSDLGDTLDALTSEQASWVEERLREARLA